MKKSYGIALLIAVIAVLWVLSGVFSPSAPEVTQSAASEAPEKKIQTVRVRDLKAEPVTTDITVTGKTQASRQVDLKAETEGQVIEIVAQKGAVVKENEVIARLEKRDREARVAEAKQRVSQRDIEYNAARELETKGFNSKVRLSQARADLEAARAELKKAQVDLDNTEIRAPFDGVIFQQDIEIGDYVSPGALLFTIVDLDPMEVHGFVTEEQVAKIAPGGKARVVFIDKQGVEGLVTYVAPAADETTRTFAIEVTMPNPDNKMVQGMTAQIMIPVAERSLHKISPSVLSLDDEGRVGVKTVDAEDKVRFVPVAIVEDRPDYMVVAGLPDKVRLITVGQEFVVEGQHVKPQVATGDGLL